VSILLSQLAPHLDNLKWFHEKNRPGFVEANAKAWTTVSEYLPHLQNLRLAERQPVVLQNVVVPPTTSEKSIDATTAVVDQEVEAIPKTAEISVQSSPVLISRLIEAKPDVLSVSVDASPVIVEQSTETEEEPESSVVKSVGTETMEPLEYENAVSEGGEHNYFIALPSIVSGLVSSACRSFFFLPLYIPYRILAMFLELFRAKRTGKAVDAAKPSRSNTESSTSSAELLDISPVCL